MCVLACVRVYAGIPRESRLLSNEFHYLRSNICLFTSVMLMRSYWNKQSCPGRSLSAAPVNSRPEMQLNVIVWKRLLWGSFFLAIRVMWRPCREWEGWWARKGWQKERHRLTKVTEKKEKVQKNPLKLQVSCFDKFIVKHKKSAPKRAQWSTSQMLVINAPHLQNTCTLILTLCCLWGGTGGSPVSSTWNGCLWSD